MDKLSTELATILEIAERRLELPADLVVPEQVASDRDVIAEIADALTRLRDRAQVGELIAERDALLAEIQRRDATDRAAKDAEDALRRLREKLSGRCGATVEVSYQGRDVRCTREDGHCSPHIAGRVTWPNTEHGGTCGDCFTEVTDDTASDGFGRCTAVDHPDSRSDPMRCYGVAGHVGPHWYPLADPDHPYQWHNDRG